jgi:hypothetical protein
VVAAFCFVAAPNLIDWTHGRQIRGWDAVAEFWRLPGAPTRGDPYAHYLTTPDQSAQTAVRYFLEYYGHPLASTDALPSNARAMDVAAFLRDHGISTTTLDLSKDTPRTAALLQLLDGTWAIADSLEGDVFRLVAPHTGREGEVTRAQLLQLIEPQAFIPAASP